MLKAGIIIPSNSPWRSQVNITTNGRHKIRLVVDYSNTIIRLTYLDANRLPKADEIVAELANYSVFSLVDLRSVYHQIPIHRDEQEYTAFEANGPHTSSPD